MTGNEGSFLAVGAVLFVLGGIGFVTRRNLILIVLSAEMMLHGVSLTLVAFGKMHNSLEGEAFTIFILTVAACEAGLLLSLVLALFQKAKSLDVELWSALRESDLPDAGIEMDKDEPPFEKIERKRSPRLVTAGQLPEIDEDIPLELVVSGRQYGNAPLSDEGEP